MQEMVWLCGAGREDVNGRFRKLYKVELCCTFIRTYCIYLGDIHVRKTTEFWKRNKR